MARFLVSAAPQPNRNPAAPTRASAKIWLFRATTALIVPTIFFLVLEGGLRVAGIGHPAGFLIPDDQPGYLRTNPDYVGLFLPEEFDLKPLNFRVAARKPANTVRIVVLGESAAQGIPVPAFAFAPQLRAQLRARYPQKNIEVINTGVVAINSHVVYQIARDLAQYAPDLFVVYLGNNEVVGPYGPGCTYLSGMRPLWVIRLGVWVRSTRTGQLVASVMGRVARWKNPPLEWGGMAMFVDNAVRGDDPRLEAVYRNFEANLRDIVRVAAGAGAKTLLCTVVSNLKDSPPFLSLNRADLTATERASWQQAYERGKLAWLLGETGTARAALQEAQRIDPHHADTAYLLGSIELVAGEVAAARRHLIEAQHWDALRFRPDPSINDIIRQVVHDSATGVSLVDAAVGLGSDPASTAIPAGRELFLEHVHFNWEGNHQLARLMARGAEAALFGDRSGPLPWLDSTQSAAALAWTAQGRLLLLQKTAEIVRRPPFTNQLTYGEDQAKLAREIGRAQTAAGEPEALRQAKGVVGAALAADPENPALTAIAEDIELGRGDAAGALAQARRAAQLLPADPALFADEASLLARLGQYDEAEKILKQATGQSDRLAPSLAALYSQMKRPAESRAGLDRAIERHPADIKLRLMRGNLAQAAGDRAAAEHEFRAILAGDPGNENALEALVSLLGERGQAETIGKESLAVAERQPGNQRNNLRVAASYEARGEEEQTIRFLSAAQRSGPGVAAIELRIARKLYRLGRRDEMMFHLAQAKRLSIIEEDPESTEAIIQLIDRARLEGR